MGAFNCSRPIDFASYQVLTVLASREKHFSEAVLAPVVPLQNENVLAFSLSCEPNIVSEVITGLCREKTGFT